MLLYTIDSTGTIEPTSWPTDWENLRRAMVSHLEGVGRPAKCHTANQSDSDAHIRRKLALKQAGWLLK